MAELASECPRLPPDGREQLLALAAEGADLVAGQAALGGTERLAELEQLLHLLAAARGHEGVDEPGGERRPAQRCEGLGAGAVALRAGLLTSSSRAPVNSSGRRP